MAISAAFPSLFWGDSSQLAAPLPNALTDSRHLHRSVKSTSLRALHTQNKLNYFTPHINEGCFVLLKVYSREWENPQLPAHTTKYIFNAENNTCAPEGAPSGYS